MEPCVRKLDPILPGEILWKEFLEPLGISQNKLARDIDVPVTRIGDIIHGRRGITADSALRLAVYFGTTPEFWLNLQTRHDLKVSKRESAAGHPEGRPPVSEGLMNTDIAGSGVQGIAYRPVARSLRIMLVRLQWRKSRSG